MILNDSSLQLETDCKTMLLQRMDMFKNAAPLVAVPENLSELYSQVVTSPSKRYFFVLTMSFVGAVFVFGLFCGRVSRRAIAMKNK